MASLLVAGFPIGSPWALLVMAIAALVAERGNVRLSATVEVSTASLPFVFAGLTHGPLAAMAVGAVGLLPDLWRRDVDNPYLRWLTWTTSRTLAAGAAGFAAFAVLRDHDRTMPWVIAAAAAACAADVVVDLALTWGTLVVRRRGTLTDVVELAPLVATSVPLYAPLLAVLAYAYANVSPWTVVLFVAPAFAAQRLFILYRQQRDTAEALVTANHRLEEVNLSFASALVATLDARDQYTAGHSAAVAVYARDIADQLGLPPDQQRLAYLCGLVHDIGKIGLPPGLLEKPGALDAEERRQMEAHPLIGETIVQKVEDYSEVAGAVRHHHERIDGTGYPDRRYGDDIPLMARIISVADAYNAMTSNRPYRDAMPTNIARARLRDSAGTQFDPTVVDAFDRVLAREPESYRRARRADFEIDTQPSSPALLEAA